jgi:hypothetical protein
MMAKLIINLDGPDALGLAYCIFKSKEDFDSDPYSPESYYRWAKMYEAGRAKPRDLPRYSYEPEKYPCLMIDCGTRRQLDGPDDLIPLYIYDFNIVDD